MKGLLLEFLVQGGRRLGDAVDLWNGSGSYFGCGYLGAAWEGRVRLSSGVFGCPGRTRKGRGGVSVPGTQAGFLPTGLRLSDFLHRLTMRSRLAPSEAGSA